MKIKKIILLFLGISLITLTYAFKSKPSEIAVQTPQSNYYVKIISKNNAGWFHMNAQRTSDGTTINVISGADPGYFPVTSPVYCMLLLPNDDVNLVTCSMGRWRDAGGDPGARPYMSNVKFVIVHIPTIGLFGEQNGEAPVTDTLDLTAKGYADEFGLTLLVNPKNKPHELVKINRTRYKDWKTATGR